MAVEKDLPELVEEFLKSQRVARTRTDYARYLRVRFIDFLRRENPSDLSVRRISIDSANRWRQHDLMPNVWIASHGTLVLKSFAGWLSKKKLLRDPSNGRSVLMGLEVPRPLAKVKKAYDDDQLEAIWDALAEREGSTRLRGVAYVHLLYATGLRKMDAGSILRNSLNLESRWLRATIKHGKGSKETRMHLSRECIVAIQNYLSDPERKRYKGPKPEPVFIREDGVKFKPEGFASWVLRLGQDVTQLTDIHWNPSLMKKTADMHARSGVFDPQLRSRVRVLLEDDRHHDRAIEIATTELEDRVREKTAAGRLDGDDLWKWAFLPEKPGSKPRLEVFADPQEQAGLFNAFRGIYALYRNRTHHKVAPDAFDPAEAKRIVQWADHLLGLIDY